MKLRLAAFGLILALLSAFVVAPLGAKAATANQTNGLTVPVTSAVTGITGGLFTGTLNITSFTTNSAGQLVANGTITGTVTQTVNGVTSTVGTITNQAFSTVVSGSGSCQILNLTIGPINLDLLGLTVQTNQIVLNITAHSGSGNLLGNLLCSVAHLLDQGNTNALANVLNGVLNLLNGVQI